VSAGQQLPVALAELDVFDPDVPDLVVALAAALASRVVVYSSTSEATALTKKASLMPTPVLRRGP